MKICANCGNQVPDDAVFCNNCGSSLASDSAAGSAPAPAPVPDAGAAAPVNEAAPVQQPVPGPVPMPGPQQGMPGPQPGMQQNFQGGYQQAPNGQMPYQQPYPQYQAAVDMSDHTSEFDAKDIADNKLFAILPYFFSCFVGLLAGIYVKDSDFVKFHIKNTIRLAIAEILSVIVMIIPFVGWILGPILLVILAVVHIIAIVNVCQGKAKDLPIVGSIGFLK